MSQDKILALIPARGGSKRLPGKNILPLKGRPLIAWTIEAARKSGMFESIVVSTDDEEIAAVANALGAEIPFLRPSGLSGDTATTFDVVKHTLETLEKASRKFTQVMVLQPTSPLRTSEDIRKAVDLKNQRKASAIISVCPCEHPPEWSNTLPPNGSMEEFLTPELIRRSQELPQSYRLNGAIYLYESDDLIKNGAMLPIRNSFAYVMDQRRSIDIDTAFDFELAEAILSMKSSP